LIITLKKMKKQNVNNRLAFNKAAVIELNNSQLTQINGGTGNSSAKCLYDAGAYIDPTMFDLGKIY
jgi:hypothetical protein